MCCVSVLKSWRERLIWLMGVLIFEEEDGVSALLLLLFPLECLDECYLVAHAWLPGAGLLPRLKFLVYIFYNNISAVILSSSSEMVSRPGCRHTVEVQWLTYRISPGAPILHKFEKAEMPYSLINTSAVELAVRVRPGAISFFPFSIFLFLSPLLCLPHRTRFLACQNRQLRSTG